MKTVKILMVAVIVTGAAAYARAVEGAGTPAAPGQSVAVSTAADMEKLSAMPLDTLKAKTKAAKDNKDYRIEVEKDKEDHEVLVKFVSPGGNTIKTISPDKAITAKSGKSLIHQSGYRESPDFDYAEYDRKLLNARGEVKWQKTWRNYPEYGVDPEAGWSGWFEGISDNGERSYVTYRSTDGVYNLVVLGVNGEEIAKVNYPEMLCLPEISPDGKIVGAETVKDGSKHFFFLEVETGKTKLVKAEGNGWDGRFMVNFLNPKVSSRGKIYLNVTLRNEYETVKGITIQKTYRGYFVFSELPSDMAELIKKEGEGK